MTVLQLGSPYWLRINGAWVALEGVAPGVTRATERPSSSFVSVGGTRHTQQAPRAPRSWSWTLPWATAEGLRLLEVASNAADVWLTDEVASQANMLAPWETQGVAGAALIADGVPLLPVPVGAVTSTPVRAGVQVRVAAWSSAAASTSLLQVTYPGGSGTVVASAGTGIRRTADLAVTPSSDGVLTTTVLAGAGAVTTGLQVYEGTVQQGRWLPGQRSPCRVRVANPEHTLALIRDGVGYGSASVTLEEVG